MFLCCNATLHAGTLPLLECVVIVLTAISSRVMFHGLVALLYVHRAFFAQGLCDHPTDPLRGTYAPSILCGYRSACQILSNLRAAFTIFPSRVSRFWVLWTHAFSASVKPLFSQVGLG